MKLETIKQAGGAGPNKRQMLLIKAYDVNPNGYENIDWSTFDNEELESYIKFYSTEHKGTPVEFLDI